MLYNVLYKLFKMFSVLFISFTDLSKNFAKVEKLVHPPTLAICIKKSPLQSAEDVVAENIKCTLKVALLIPHFSEVFTTQRTLVLAETDLCRAVSITKKGRTRILS